MSCIRNAPPSLLFPHQSSEVVDKDTLSPGPKRWMYDPRLAKDRSVIVPFYRYILSFHTHTHTHTHTPLPLKQREVTETFSLSLFLGLLTGIVCGYTLPPALLMGRKRERETDRGHLIPECRFAETSTQSDSSVM